MEGKNQTREGRKITFWEDIWYGSEPLCEVFSVLYTIAGHGSKNRPGLVRLGRVVTASLLTAPRSIPATRLSDSV